MAADSADKPAAGRAAGQAAPRKAAPEKATAGSAVPETAAQEAAEPKPPAPAGGSGGTWPEWTPPDLDFPFLTREIDLDGRGGSAQVSGGGTTGQTVERELREILGWRPRAGDPKGFLAALQQSFTVTEVAGHTEVAWKPRSYSVEIQADLGAITGAQASIYTRAKNTLDQVLPLLDGLTPLRVDFDPENVAAAKAIVRSQLTELVAELGVSGGPRVLRVDQLFDFLLFVPLQRAAVINRTPQISRDPADVNGSLGLLRNRLGLDRRFINTIDEEQDFTNFLIVLDHVAGLFESWTAQRPFFVRGSGTDKTDQKAVPFLGTQLVLLSRDLEVIVESVHEVEFAMDSVFLGAAERQTLELTFPGVPDPLFNGKSPSPPMFVSELLGWVERFATEEGRRLIDEGGRQGVAAVTPTLELLRSLVDAAQDQPQLPEAYRRPRVRRALHELAGQLENALNRARPIGEPDEDGSRGRSRDARN